MENPEDELFSEVQSVDDLVLAANQELEARVLQESNRAFNMGCALWLIPGGLLIAAIFVISKANWAMTGITIVLIGLAAIVFALFVASRSKSKSPTRIYEDQLASEVQRKLSDLAQTREAFVLRAHEILPDETLLGHHLRRLDIEEPTSKNNLREEV
jgi:multisubunit Na+/H+ antiporter MnhC subunit